MKHCTLLLIFTLLASLQRTMGGVAEVQAQAKRDPYLGFDLSNSIVALQEIVGGGPPKDGIPAILAPRFIPTEQVDYLPDNAMVISVTRNGKSRAYPLSILLWHEVVNDTLNGQPIAVTYCPLCGTSMVFDRLINGRQLTFGVSGLLYRSDVLLYDHQTESLWSQLGMQAVAGRQVRTPLRWLPSELMTWASWRSRYPQSEVLSLNTGFQKNYGANLYHDYMNSPNLMFNVPQFRNEFPKKSWVVGVIVAGIPKAYPYSALKTPRLKDRIGDTDLLVHYDPASRNIQCTTLTGEPLPHVSAYWFAWQAFYPNTQIYASK